MLSWVYAGIIFFEQILNCIPIAYHGKSSEGAKFVSSENSVVGLKIKTADFHQGGQFCAHAGYFKCKRSFVHSYNWALKIPNIFLSLFSAASAFHWCSSACSKAWHSNVSAESPEERPWSKWGKMAKTVWPCDARRKEIWAMQSCSSEQKWKNSPLLQYCLEAELSCRECTLGIWRTRYYIMFVIDRAPPKKQWKLVRMQETKKNNKQSACICRTLSLSLRNFQSI